MSGWKIISNWQVIKSYEKPLDLNYECNYCFATGDFVLPNSAGEIHLEKCFKGEIYKEYKSDCDLNGDKCLSERRFFELWNKYFPHVKIRQFKQVAGTYHYLNYICLYNYFFQGKCHTCTYLSGVRSQATNKLVKTTITEFHALHRCTYMGERKKYYERKED